MTLHTEPLKITALPIVIGFTGHRDLRTEDIEPLRESVAGIYRDLLSHYPSTPLTVLSSLAEGADRLGAQVALDMGIDLICPLPFSPELYKQDFPDDASRADFDRILTASKSWFVLPIVEGATEAGIKENGHQRDLQYAQVGAYHAQHSQIMIALWDGQVLDSIGGTGKVVHYKLQGVPKLFGKTQSPLDPVETGPVYHVLTPRIVNPIVDGVYYTVKKYYPRGYGSDEEAELAFKKIFEQLDKFNNDATRLTPYLLASKPKSQEYLYGQLKKEEFSEELNSIIDHYGTADCLATHYQRFTKRAFKYIFSFVFLAAVSFDLYAHLWENEIVLVGYLASLVMAFLWYTYAQRKHYQTKYLDYRALAEGLRVQFFWRYIGLPHDAGDYYIRKQKSEMDWIRFAMRTAAIPRGDYYTAVKIDAKQIQRLTSVMHSWVEDQAKYYPKALKRDHKRLHRLERSINILFYIGVGLAVIQLIFEIPHGLKHFLILGTGIAPITAALIGGYIERNALVGHIKQYERTGILFSQAKEYLSRLLDTQEYEDASDFIFELGAEALTESGDWMLLHRDRPIEVPKG